jgi:GNAT superfamily N-acetyltransferase
VKGNEIMEYKLITNVPNHLGIQDGVTSDAWPEFMYHDPVSNRNWEKLFEWFPEFQLSLISGDDVVGIANSIPYYWDKPFEELPEEGWDWTIHTGVEGYMKGVTPNVLNGLQITVNKNYLGKGISSIIVKEMINMAREHGFRYITIPVRPNFKSKYPLISIDNYINWRREDGMPFDPWLRVHVRCGAKVIKPCHRAMYIPGSISDWEEWTNLKFLESGDYIVEGALFPVSMDISRDIGEYIEPNVWVVYEV